MKSKQNFTDLDFPEDDDDEDYNPEKEIADVKLCTFVTNYPYSYFDLDVIQCCFFFSCLVYTVMMIMKVYYLHI